MTTFARNITAKTGMGSYTYESLRPHVVKSADVHTYTHDANGNMLTGADRSMSWNVANLPVTITKGSVAGYFSYGPDRARFKQALTGSGATETTHYVGGLYERLTRDPEKKMNATRSIRRWVSAA